MKRGLFVLAVCLMTACASPEVNEMSETEQLELSSGVTAETFSGEERTEIEADHGRHIVQTVEGNDSVIEIDADVDIASGQLYKGKVEIVFPTVEEIEKVFAHGQKMENYIDSEYGEMPNEWCLYSGASGVDAEFKLSYYLVSDHAAYSDLSIKSIPSGDTDVQTMQEDELTEEAKQLFEESKEEAYGILDALKVESMPFPGRMEVFDDIYVSYVSTVSDLDGVAAVRDNQRFITNTVTVNENGIEDIQFGGSLSMGESEPVRVLSVDEIMEIFCREVKDGNIYLNNEDLIIERIGLYYYIDYENGRFLPVWCFCAGWTEDPGSISPCVCLNAETGGYIY